MFLFEWVTLTNGNDTSRYVCMCIYRNKAVEGWTQQVYTGSKVCFGARNNKVILVRGIELEWYSVAIYASTGRLRYKR